MPTLNIFNDDAFSLVNLTAAVQEIPFTPGRLGAMGLYGTPEGLISTAAEIEFENDTLTVVPVSQRGAPGTPMSRPGRRLELFSVPHIKPTDSLTADEILGLRSFGKESEVETVAKVVAQRMAKMRRAIEYTKESHRMLGLKGLTVDRNGNQVNLFARFGVSQDTIAFALGNAATSVRKKSLELLESIEDSLSGLSFSGVRVLCGKNFWTDLIEHSSVRDSYLATTAASELRGDPRLEFEFAGIVWERYRGTSDVKIGDDEAYAVPEGVVDLFIVRNAPADYIETVGTLGQDVYAKQWLMEADRGVNLEVQANPLHLCTRPKAVKKLTK